MFSRAIYPLSADPWTRGHSNILVRSLNLFDEVIVGIGSNPSKKYTFTLEERESLTSKVLKEHGNRVSVKSYKGLLADFAYENGIYNIIRGVRNSADFDFERLLHDINQGMDLQLDTVTFIADKALSHVSSSSVKELQQYHGKNVIDYVHLVTKKALEQRISNQQIIGVTGGIACGKSFVCEKLLNLFKHEGWIVSAIDMDEIGRCVLESCVGPIYDKTRSLLADHLGKDILKDDGFVNINKLKASIFSYAGNRVMFDEIVKEPCSLLLRRRIAELNGLIIINCALISEAGLATLVNNNVVVVDCDKDTQIERLKKRGYSSDEVANRLAAQLSSDEKYEHLQEDLKKHDYGCLLRYDNTSNKDEAKKIRNLFNAIIEKFIPL